MEMKQGLHLELRGGWENRGELKQLLLLSIRPRTSFCPVRKALDMNDEQNVLGYAGAATAEVLLSAELDRREQNRVKRRMSSLDI